MIQNISSNSHYFSFGENLNINLLQINKNVIKMFYSIMILNQT
jgi:hypothetical protein